MEKPFLNRWIDEPADGGISRFEGRTVKLLIVTAAFLLLFSGPARASDWTQKAAGESWTWCEDYVFAYATYIVACEPTRECQVGMGIFAFGEPRGEKVRFSGEREITVIGIGSLHIRTTDRKGPAKAAFILKNAELIKTPPIKW